MFKKLISGFFIFLITIFSVRGVFAQAEVEYSGGGLTFIQLMQAGGWVMAVIVLISILIITLAGFCFSWLRKDRFVPADIRRMILDQIANKRFQEAYLISDGKTDSFCRVVGSGLKRASLFAKEKNNQKGESIEVFYLMEHIKKMMESSGLREADKLRTLVSWFANVGVVAPMLGLLGTVLGMIRAFGAIAFKVEAGRPVLLSSAISQAMVTTAGGLIIGILSMALFYYFTSKVNAIINELEFSSEEVAEEIEQALRNKG